MNPILSILIPTVVGREVECSQLFSKFKGKVGWKEVVIDRGSYTLHCAERLDGMVSIIVCKDNKEMTIGEKRELLYKEAYGQYSVQWDDDDDIADNGIELILNALKQHIPDVVTYKEKCVINGKYFSSNHSLLYDKWQDNFDGYDFVRCPFYKDVIKTEIAQSVPFPKIRWNEDEQWSMAIRPLLHYEIHIDEEIYFYIHNSKPEDHATRYGLDRE